MTDISIYIFLFIIPGLLGNVSHMVVVKKDIFRCLSIPLSIKLFGRNKTWRGFIYLPVAMGFICLIESTLFGPFSKDHLKDVLISTALGLVYMISELPNSAFKRRLGIAAGESAPRFRIIQLIIDKTDSLAGACIFFAWVLQIKFAEILLLFLFCVLLHFGISYLLFVLGLKKSI
jgi:CDP-diacylglycerol--serine O-phosphatidyltransferase